MGGVSAKNVIDNSMSSMVSVTNSTVQNCSPAISVSQVLDFSGANCPGAELDIASITLRSTAMMDVECAQKAVASADVKTQLDQIASQMADAVSQALSLNPASTDAENIMRLSMAVGVAVHNSAAQTIASAVSSSQLIKIADFCKVNIGPIDMETFASSYAKATQESSQVASAVTALKQAAEQVAKSKQESLIGPLIVILLIVLAVVFGGPIIAGKLAKGVAGSIMSARTIKIILALAGAAVAFYVGYRAYTAYTEPAPPAAAS